MTFCFIGSGMERELTRTRGIEVRSIARAMHSRFDRLVFGGSSAGLMADFASAFLASGGHVVSVIPQWLHDINQVFEGGEPRLVADLAERKRVMFDEVDAVLCYPGGVGTWDELFDLVARRAIDAAVHAKAPCPPVYLYNWEKYYAPLLLQIETAVEVGLIHPAAVAMIHPFETADELDALLGAHPGAADHGEMAT
ncbi:MAG: LOG family protein [Vicinamibacterales bacterium]